MIKTDCIKYNLFFRVINEPCGFIPIPLLLLLGIFYTIMYNNKVYIQTEYVILGGLN